MSQYDNPRQLFTTLTADDELILSIEPLDVPEPEDDEVVVEVQAAPINPSDLVRLVAPADMKSARLGEADGRPALVADVRAETKRMFAGRVGKKLPAGNEGAGTVVAAGSSGAAQALLGKTVTMVGGMMYRTHCVVKARDVLALPDGADAAEGASLFVNPMTVQGFVNTMRGEGHSAIVHTAAASNLGRMLAKLCAKEEIPLVAIVRRDEQRALLSELGVKHIVDSSRESFMHDLVAAIAQTGATLAFDAIGGGRMANDILVAMEQAQIQLGGEATIYGTPVHKQVYIYGRLDLGTTELTAGCGMYWSVGGWLLPSHLRQVGVKRMIEMRRYAIEERNGLFASAYSHTISLEEMIDPDTARAYDRKATGEKFLVDPSR
jgi:NADPH2:quinone reductase